MTLELLSGEKANRTHVRMRLGDGTMISNPTDDFKKNTLRALPTLLEKLAYICSLQTKDGMYRHWGLSRVFGEKKAHQALEALHAEMAAELTHLPIREIYEEYERASRQSVNPQMLKPESLELKTPANDDELLSAHLQLIQHSIVSVAEQ
jgi:hypothetical protein